MKIIRLRRSISVNTIAIYIAMFCVATYALLENTSVTFSPFSMVKMPLMYLGGICLLTQVNTIFRVLLKKNYFYMLASAALLCVLLAVSALINRNAAIGDSPLRHTVRLMLYLVELFLLIIVLIETDRIKPAIGFLFWYVLIIVAVNDILMFSRILTFRSGRFEAYIVGGKFSVSYLHLYLLTLWVIRRKQRLAQWKHDNLIVVLLTALAICAAIRVDCMTGVLGSLAMLVLLWMIDSPKKKRIFRFTSPWMLTTALVLCVVLAFLIDTIMKFSVVEYLVEEVLGRDTTITGRTNIYEVYIDRMQGHWLAGYGYGNGNEASVTLFGYENVQNAVLQWLLQVGVPATMGLMLLFVQVFRQIRRTNLELILPMVAMLYVCIILGTIETTFNMAFILWFGVVFMLANEKRTFARESNYRNR